MSAAIRAEFRKFFTTRLWWGMAIAVHPLGRGLRRPLRPRLHSDVAGAPRGAVPSTDTALAKAVFTGGIQVGYLLTLAIGVMTIGAEYRHQTITATFLAVPRRGRVMGAKIISLLVIGAFYGVLSLAGAVVAGTLVLTAKGAPPLRRQSTFGRTLALSLLVLGLWALIGLGAGILIPNQVAALLISDRRRVDRRAGARGSFSRSPTGARTSPPTSRAGPGSAMLEATSGGFNGEPVEQLSWWAGALVLAAYAAVMAGLGTWRTVRRDIA